MPKAVKWTEIEQAKAEALLTDTRTPGIVYGLDPVWIPETFQAGMTGVSSFYVSEAIVPQALSDGKVVKGEFMLAREVASEMKHYGYMFSLQGEKVIFTQLPRGFGHHWEIGKPVEINSLFHHGPYPDP